MSRLTVSGDEIEGALETARILSTQESLLDLSRQQPILLVFLRHLGCVFCRQAVDDLKQVRSQLQAVGVVPVFVHQEPGEEAPAFFDKFGTGDELSVSDPDRILYRAFGLDRGSFGQVMGLSAVVKGTTAFFRFGAQKPTSDPMQMPGVFVVKDGNVLTSYRHKTSSDRPDYVALAQSALALEKDSTP